MKLALIVGLFIHTSAFILSAAERVALVVGCANYKADSSLTLDTPLKDAKDLADLLQSPALGFQVVQVPDATATQFYAGLKQFKTAAQGARIAMVYFSGHGIEQDGTNYLITTNAELETPEALETETMPLEKVMKSLNETGATVKLAVLDCCRNNPFAQTKSKSWLKTKDFVRDQVLKELGDIDLPEATLVCFATSAGRKAAAVLDAQSQNSPFTDFLLQEMKTPGQSLRTIFENVHDKLKEATNGRQVPVVQTKNSVDELIRKTVLLRQRKFWEIKDDGISPRKSTPTNPPLVTTKSGLQYSVTKLGSGSKPSATSTVKAHYRGTLMDGTEIDNSYARGEPATFALRDVIAGWNEGCQLMPVGSTFRLIIPSNLAYGEAGSVKVPPNSTLIFDIELLDLIAPSSGN